MNLDRDAIAKIIYDADPFYESGEYIDGHCVSPGRNLSWQQALDYDAEFGGAGLLGTTPITKWAYDVADKILRADGQRGETNGS